MVARDGDSHCCLGGDIYITHSCGGCETCPTKPNKWLRCSNLAGYMLAGSSMPNGYWHCPSCLDKWPWGKDDAKRLMLIPDTDRPGELKKVLIGVATSEQERTITLLKSAQLLTEVQRVSPDHQTKKTVKISKESLVKAIDRLNERCDNRILKSINSISIKSASSQQIEDKGLFAYCEDTALSLKFPGSVYKALSVPADTAVLSDDDRAHLLNVLCCFYDFDQYKPGGNRALRQAWYKAVQTQMELGEFYWPEV